MPAIEFQNVVFAYGDRTILKNVNFVIEQGKFAAILGGSGSGKTTMMRLITGQLRPSSGKVLVNGEDLAQFSAQKMQAHRRNMGVLFQHGALFTDLSVEENIMFPMRELTKLPPEVMRDLAVLARTIALDPQLMLFDEPFTGLDPISLGVIAHLIYRVTKALRSTSVMVTHDVGHSLQLVDQIIFLAHGEILFSGSPDEMVQSDSAWIKQFVGGLPNGPVAFRYPADKDMRETMLGRL